MASSFLQRLKLAAENDLDVLFKPAETRFAKGIAALLLVGLFVLGIFHWGYFLDWFNNRFDIQDWHDFVGPYLIFLRQALQSGQLPLHVSSPLIYPDRYLARPNHPITPVILLLYFLKPAAFPLVNVWILYAAGFIGLLLIRRRYRLSFAAFLPLFLLFNFNGHITDQYVIGHMEWAGYFLLPFYVLLVLQMVEGEKTGWKWLLYMALTMLGINLQGAFHIFFWCMAFLVLLALFQPRYWTPVLKAILASALASMIRILPAALEYYSSGGIQFLSGFLSVTQMLESFVVLHLPYVIPLPWFKIGGWEFDYFVGLLGFFFIVYFGLIRSWSNTECHRSFYLPILVMAFFSIGDIYRPIFYSHIPFADSQRVPTRFLIVPVLFMMTLASLQFELFVEKWGRERWKEKLVVSLGLIVMGLDLIQHSRFWRLPNLYPISERYTDVIRAVVSNHPDPPYIISIIIGLTLTVITPIVLAVLAHREKKIGA